LKEELPPQRALGALVIVIGLALIAFAVLRQRFGHHRNLPRIQSAECPPWSQVMLAS
jgi:drug/metabolite transporter (DMT)-like permease